MDGGIFAQDGSGHLRPLPYRGPQQDGALHHRPGGHGGALPQHGIGPHDTAGRQADPCPDPAGLPYLYPGGAGAPACVQVQRHLALQSVVDTLQVGAAVPHILPVAGHLPAAEGLPPGQELGKEVFPEVTFRPVLHQLHGLVGEDIDSGIHQLGVHLAPAGLLHKAQDAALGVGAHQAVLQGLGAAAQGQGGHGAAAAVEGHELA